VSTPHPIDGGTRLYGIIGHPVAKSLSPCMQNAAFRAASLNAVYVPFPTQPEHLDEAVAGLTAAGLAGFNLTVPHKQAILPRLYEITPEAKVIGAVNTVRCDDGRLRGTNTDAAGFLLSLEHDLGWRANDRRVVMLGAGGAARAVAYAVLGAGASELVVANRTADKAEALCTDMRTLFPAAAVHPRGLDELAGTAPHLLVNTTSVGMGDDGRSPVELEPVGVRDAVVDIIYSPLETPLLAQARTLGLKTANGVGMLLYQGWLAFRYWTDREASLESMRQALSPYVDVVPAR